MMHISKSRPGSLVVIAASLFFASACGWWGDERAAIRGRLQEFVATVNRQAPEGLGTVTHSAAIGRYFTEDVTIDPGRGGAPINGREMLMGIAARLRPRTAEYRVQLADVTVRLAPDELSAEVELTAEFIRREPGARQSMDAREFALTMRREGGEWLIARVTAVETLK